MEPQSTPHAIIIIIDLHSPLSSTWWVSRTVYANSNDAIKIHCRPGIVSDVKLADGRAAWDTAGATEKRSENRRERGTASGRCALMATVTRPWNSTAVGRPVTTGRSSSQRTKFSKTKHCCATTAPE